MIGLILRSQFWLGYRPADHGEYESPLHIDHLNLDLDLDVNRIEQLSTHNVKGIITEGVTYIRFMIYTHI